MKIQKEIMQRKNQIAVVSGVLIVFAFLFKFVLHWAVGYQYSMALASVLGAAPIVIQAFQALKVKVISIDLLVSIAVVGAFIIGEYNESAIVTFLFLFGSLLEQRTLEKTRSAIQELTKMAPASALRIKDDEIEKVDIEDVEEGDLLLVKTGGQVPVDGFITEGSGYLNEASVTGESKMAQKTVGDNIFAGSILENGTLKVEAEKVGEDTTFGKIIELVEEAQDSKSSAERFIDKFAKYYTPAILLLSLVVELVTQNVHLAITILVLGCPGALVIGVPVSNVAGIGNGAKNGVLIKGGEIMETFNRVDTLVFDKTGTLTDGRPTVSVVKNYSQDMETVLRLAASVERESDHPLGQAILNYAKKNNFDSITKTNVVKGQGIAAFSGDKEILVGNQKLMDAHHIPLSSEALKNQKELQSQGNSIVFVAVDGQLALLIGVKDQVRSGVKEALVQLKKMGVKRLILLTGDNQETAEIVAKELGITEVHGNLLPEEKSSYIQQLKEAGNTVAFVGDGVNDSPSIALADIGIAMGSGTDAAIETSDVVLMQSRFDKLVHAYGLTKRTVANMKENIVIAVGTVLFLLLGLIVGYIYMASGMLIHEISVLVVVVNGMRLLGYHLKKGKLDSYQGKDIQTRLN